MGLVIANNVASLNAQHNLTRSTIGLTKSLERLSSGFKVNRGADNPAALVISEKQRAQIAGLAKAIENTEKAISLVQTAEGALNEINHLLVKIRSLALDSANTGVNDQEALDANQSELEAALDTIDRIAKNTQFGRKQLLDGSAGITGTTDTSDVTFHKGTANTQAGTYSVVVTSAGSRANIAAGTAQTAALAADEVLTINGTSIELSAGLSQAQVVNRINEFTGQTGVVADANGAGGATRLYTIAFGTDAAISVASSLTPSTSTTGFANTVTNATGTNMAGTVGGETFTGIGNVATATTGVVKGLILSVAADTGANAHLTQTGTVGNITVLDKSLVFQVGPNQHQSASIGISRVNPESLGLNVSGNQFTHLGQVRVDSASAAQDAIGIIDEAIDDITSIRGELGAFQQNTLEATANNLRTTLENTVNAESVIRDTDFAVEVANFTKYQVLVQAGTSVLSNANQASQLVLGLLQ